MNAVAEKKALRAKAAYTLVDVSGLPDDVRKAIVEDANIGGSEYGVRVVEEHINGPARVPVYGVYDFDAEKWGAAKEELSIAAEEVDDAAVDAAPVNETDEGALRLRAQEQANALADEARTADAERLKQITGDEPAPPAEQGKTNNKAPR